MKTRTVIFIYTYIYILYYDIKNLARPFRVNSYWHMISSKLQIPEYYHVGT